MEVRSQAVRLSIFCVLLLAIEIGLVDQVYGQTVAAPGQPGAGNTSPAGDINQGGIDAGSLDKLLDMAEKDVGQLSNVNVSGHTGSPSLDQPVSTVERQQSTVGKTPAAVFVITNEMIRRSGRRPFPTSCGWFQACRWRRSLRTNGPLGAGFQFAICQPAIGADRRAYGI